MKGKCMQASIFMSKPSSDSSDTSYPESEPIYSLAETSQSNTSESHDDEFVFYDGVSFVADPQLCAEFCGRIPECHSFQFVELLEDDEVDLGMCILNAQKRNEISESLESESDFDASLPVVGFVFFSIYFVSIHVF